MKNSYYLFVLVVFACSPKVNSVQLNEEFKKSISDTTEIIATQFKDEGMSRPNIIIWNDAGYNNVFMIDDHIYFDFEPVQHILNNSKTKSRSEYKYSISLDKNYIKRIVESHKMIYSGQNRLVTWE